MVPIRKLFYTNEDRSRFGDFWNESAGRIQALLFDLLLQSMWRRYVSCTTKSKIPFQRCMDQKIYIIEDTEAIIHLITASDHHDGYGFDKI